MTDPDHDLRALLDDAVSDVEPRGGLGEIRGAHLPRPAPALWAWGAAGAVAATAAVIAARGQRRRAPGTGPSRPGPADGGTADAATPRGWCRSTTSATPERGRGCSGRCTSARPRAPTTRTSTRPSRPSTATRSTRTTAATGRPAPESTPSAPAAAPPRWR